MLCVVVVGEDWLVSAVLQVVLQVTSATETPCPLLRLLVVPTCESTPLLVDVFRNKSYTSFLGTNYMKRYALNLDKIFVSRYKVV